MTQDKSPKDEKPPRGKPVKIPGTFDDAITRLVPPEKPKGKPGPKKGSKDKSTLPLSYAWQAASAALKRSPSVRPRVFQRNPNSPQ